MLPTSEFIGCLTCYVSLFDKNIPNKNFDEVRVERGVTAEDTQ